MKFSLLSVCLCFVIIGQAQTYDEWFHQKKTRKKYLLEQIAALQIYLEYAKEGYSIVGKGLQTIEKIKSGDFSLHSDFFGSLKQINPAIKKWSRVADIIACQVAIVKCAAKALRRARADGHFNNEELQYCNNVFGNLLDDCSANIEELIVLLTPAELEMKDDERVERISEIYLDMQDKYAFTCSFGRELSIMSIQRIAEEVEVNNSKLINGVR